MIKLSNIPVFYWAEHFVRKVQVMQREHLWIFQGKIKYWNVLPKCYKIIETLPIHIKKPSDILIQSNILVKWFYDLKKLRQFRNTDKLCLSWQSFYFGFPCYDLFENPAFASLFVCNDLWKFTLLLAENEKKKKDWSLEERNTKLSYDNQCIYCNP